MNAIASSLATPLALPQTRYLGMDGTGTGSGIAIASTFREGWSAGDSNPQDESGNLAEMMGTTRVAGQFFHESLRKLGFIDFDGGIGLQVHSSLLNIVLHD
jgi:hypothetical protein